MTTGSRSRDSASAAAAQELADGESEMPTGFGVLGLLDVGLVAVDR